jgi:prophage regulatory protein
MSAQTSTPISLLRRPQVQARTGLSRSSMYKAISEGTFPKPIPLGAKAVAWVDRQVDDWIAAKIECAVAQ